ncbi:hypothetical protein PPYR_14318 [Photinus pyralis]|uniref:Nucleolar protein 16 n=1 Tax=Photinus pyralis TaxID=7054 RepID=A0A1Y1L4Y7_PHOPY|nr:nucleolar protein 16 [Photinus pyralis]KAB0792359.1 hypothetical protein PPYR_14318 [Photinus pyralis]
MAKLRKVRRRQKYRYNVNRKRQRNKIENKGKFESKVVKNAWIAHKSAQSNLRAMGLSYDPNKTIKAGLDKDSEEEKVDEAPIVSAKAYVAEELEKEAKAKRVRNFRLPDGQVRYLIYLMKKYGDDYKAMVKDKKNYNQETWKQIRAKIEKFKSIPEQYCKYLN